MNEQQQAAFDAVKEGRSVFITGGGGTGKSYLLDQMQQAMRIAVTATTGIAALNVNGATIHSFTGLGLGNIPAENAVKNLKRRARDYNDPRYERLKYLKTLAIDELSMLEVHYFKLLDEFFRLLREDDSPFGGLQLVMFGDFLQLPPVVKTGIARFAFECPEWDRLSPDLFMLRQTYRQADQSFADILHEIRMGRLSERGRELIEERFHAVDEDPEKAPVVLNTHNQGCDQRNGLELKKFLTKNPPSLYSSVDWGAQDYHVDNLDKNCLAPRELTLCPGARVMLLKNIDPYAGLANGSIGTVTKCYNKEVSVEFDNGTSYALTPQEWEVTNGEEVLATRKQIPLRLAWAVTVHKSQGMSLDKVEAHLDKCFAQGQAYVALSRARTREGLFIRGGTKINISANPRAIEFYRNNFA